MAKNSMDAYGALGKSNVLFFDPDSLELVTDPAHPLYDERVSLPLKEPMVLNIMALGVIQPIVITKDPETGRVLVAAGRQRVKHAREANKRLKARGEEPIQVPAVVRRADGDGLAGVMISENEQREDDTPLGRAAKMRRLMDRGRGEDYIAILFGCSPQTVKHTLALLDSTAEVRQAVEAGAITVTAAHKLAKLEPSEQRAKLADIIKAGEGTKGHAKAQAQRAVVDSKPRMKGRKEIAARIKESDGEFRAALLWVLGGEDEAPAVDERQTHLQLAA